MHKYIYTNSHTLYQVVITTRKKESSRVRGMTNERSRAGHLSGGQEWHFSDKMAFEQRSEGNESMNCVHI